jgi:hypothetical protein
LFKTLHVSLDDAEAIHGNEHLTDINPRETLADIQALAALL